LQAADLVLHQFEGRPSKLHPKWDGPFIIHQENSNGSFKLKAPNGKILSYTTNGDRLKKYYGHTKTLYFNQNVHKGEGTRMGHNKEAQRVYKHGGLVFQRG